MEFSKFVKTGETCRLDCEGQKEWDGDEGFNIEVDIDDAEIKPVLVNLIITNYIKVYKLQISLNELNVTRKIIANLLDDYDNFYEEACEEFREDLQDYFSDMYSEINFE